MTDESSSNEPIRESARIWFVPHLKGLSLLRATYVTYSFKRHWHDYFVIGMIEQGVQKFAYRREQYFTPPTGLIVLNPSESHTGESAIADGFQYRALYPEAQTLQQIASEIKGRPHDIPFFSQPVIHDTALFAEMRRLHTTLEADTSILEHESRLMMALAQFITRHADTRLVPSPIKRERHEIIRLRNYIHEHYTDEIKLAELASFIHWSPFYLLRAFRKEVGLTPHAYLESVRIRRAQQLLKAGFPLAQIAYETGFNSQSHFTTSFKRFIGVTPGQYAKEGNFLKDTNMPHPLP
ncbi:MAG: AraC family transcriptional regulator [Chitinophagaceae bacterium]|nr:AraC family transcriptional regulator [Anaerolineae bacterium]